jgi:thioredoxin 1
MNHLNKDLIQQELNATPWLVSCLCAAWCDTCNTYNETFNVVSQLHQNKCFTWIDIEDHSELVEDVDLENFPTILVQFKDKLLFLGTVIPDAKQLHRLIQSLEESLEINDEPKSLLKTNQLPPNNWNLREQLMK